MRDRVDYLLVLPVWDRPSHRAFNTEAAKSAMTRNSKSNNDGAVFTYYERHVAKLGGTRRCRLGGDSLKRWHECALSLRTPRDAVVTPGGVVYDREAILRHLIEQKRGQKQKRGKTPRSKVHPKSDATKTPQHPAVAANHPALPPHPKDRPAAPAAAAERAQHLNFWLPGGRCGGSGTGGGELGVGVVGMKGERRGRGTVCPVTGERLRLCDLISVRLLRSSDGEGGGVDLYLCAVCSSALSNASKPVALRTGSVLCSRCVEQFVLCDNDPRDPVTSKEIDAEKDVITIFHHGTGFAGSAADDPGSRVASWYQPSMT